MLRQSNRYTRWTFPYPWGWWWETNRKVSALSTRKHCDFLVHIPAGGPLQSLNAATAGAIALAEAQRQRLAIAVRPKT